MAEDVRVGDVWRVGSVWGESPGVERCTVDGLPLYRLVSRPHEDSEGRDA